MDPIFVRVVSIIVSSIWRQVWQKKWQLINILRHTTIVRNIQYYSSSYTNISLLWKLMVITFSITMTFHLIDFLFIFSSVQSKKTVSNSSRLTYQQSWSRGRRKVTNVQEARVIDGDGRRVRNSHDNVKTLQSTSDIVTSYVGRRSAN